MLEGIHELGKEQEASVRSLAERYGVTPAEFIKHAVAGWCILSQECLAGNLYSSKVVEEMNERLKK